MLRQSRASNSFSGLRNDDDDKLKKISANKKSPTLQLGLLFFGVLFILGYTVYLNNIHSRVGIGALSRSEEKAPYFLKRIQIEADRFAPELAQTAPVDTDVAANGIDDSQFAETPQSQLASAIGECHELLSTVRISHWFQDKSAAMSATFDDGNAVEEVVASLDKFGFKGSFYLITESHQPDSGWEKLKEFIRMGHEIGSHTVTHKHLSQLSLNEIDAELLQSRKFLAEKLGITPESMTLAYPYGDYNSQVIDIARKYYLAARVAEAQPAVCPGTPPDLWALRATPFDDVTTMNNLMDYAVATGNWLIEYSHGTDKANMVALAKQKFEKHYGYVKQLEKEGSVWVATLGNVIRYIHERQVYDVLLERVSEFNPESTQMKCKVYLHKNAMDELPPDPVPLTLSFDLAPNVRISSSGALFFDANGEKRFRKLEFATRETEGGKRVASIDISPELLTDKVELKFGFGEYVLPANKKAAASALKNRKKASGRAQSTKGGKGKRSRSRRDKNSKNAAAAAAAPVPKSDTPFNFGFASDPLASSYLPPKDLLDQQQAAAAAAAATAAQTAVNDVPISQAPLPVDENTQLSEPVTPQSLQERREYTRSQEDMRIRIEMEKQMREYARWQQQQALMDQAAASAESEQAGETADGETQISDPNHESVNAGLNSFADFMRSHAQPSGVHPHDELDNLDPASLTEAQAQSSTSTSTLQNSKSLEMLNEYYAKLQRQQSQDNLGSDQQEDFVNTIDELLASTEEDLLEEDDEEWDDGEEEFWDETETGEENEAIDAESGIDQPQEEETVGADSESQPPISVDPINDSDSQPEPETSEQLPPFDQAPSQPIPSTQTQAEDISFLANELEKMEVQQNGGELRQEEQNNGDQGAPVNEPPQQQETTDETWNQQSQMPTKSVQQQQEQEQEPVYESSQQQPEIEQNQQDSSSLFETQDQNQDEGSEQLFTQETADSASVYEETQADSLNRQPTNDFDQNGQQTTAVGDEKGISDDVVVEPESDSQPAQGDAPFVQDQTAPETSHLYSSMFGGQTQQTEETATIPLEDQQSTTTSDSLFQTPSVDDLQQTTPEVVTTGQPEQQQQQPADFLKDLDSMLAGEETDNSGGDQVDSASAFPAQERADTAVANDFVSDSTQEQAPSTQQQEDPFSAFRARLREQQERGREFDSAADRYRSSDSEQTQPLY